MCGKDRDYLQPEGVVETMTRHIAYFIENILRPFITELDDLLGKCEHLKINSEDIKDILADILFYKTIVAFVGALCFLSFLYFIGFCFGFGR